ncbi:MAG: endonuclease/exonuclease/phosphatase family protein [archaeon]|nr:endonuclease/exonuclease/phosphatase family protein [archaeon]
MSGPVMSSDDLWQPSTEKQTLPLGNEGTFRWLHLGFGFGIASVCVALMVVLAPFSPVADIVEKVSDCSENPSLFSSDEELSTLNESGIRDGDCLHDLEIASWNVKRFGPSGAGNETRVAEMAGKISNYDIVAVQEIKDIQQTAPYILQDGIGEISEYGMVLSNRTGAFCENKSSSQISEQYAFYYDVKTIKSLDSGNHYPNNDCEYTREPFAARFVSVEFNHTFVLITLHIDPDDVLNETEALVNVFEWAKFQYPGEDDFILLGDLNADCSYARSSELDELAIRNDDYQWIIPDGTNTNTAESSSCAYDRMIIGDGGSDEYLGSFSTDCELEASDHCIISARFSSHESSAVSS